MTREEILPRMNADERGLALAGLTEKAIGAFYEVYNQLGHGFLESVYAKALLISFQELGFQAENEWPLKVWFKDHLVGEFRADIVLEGSVIVEVKAAKKIDQAHEAQLLNYLRASPIEVGLLFNFGPRPEFKRFAFLNSRKKIRVHPR